MVPKFRAWDDARDEYFEVRSLSFPVSSNDKLGIVATAGVQTAYGPNMILEQSTGLKDEGDVDIYEGDIVCVSDVYGDVCYVDAVIWGGKDGYPAFDLKNHAMEYDSNALSSIVNGGFEIIEVIGNVHENPELLEAQHDTRTD